MPEIVNPYRRSIVAAACLTLAFSAPAAAALALVVLLGWTPIILFFAAAFWGLLYLALLITWFMGVRDKRRIREFLESTRPLIRWTYMEHEWNEIAQKEWAEEKDDWKIQIFGLTFIFGLVGVLTGLMLLDEDIFFLPMCSAVGIGGGFLLGVVIAASNYLAAKIDYATSKPVVALGENEIYYGGQYFRANGGNYAIRNVALNKGPPATLEIQVYSHPSFSKTHGDLTWTIQIPPQLVKEVELRIPSIKVVKDDFEEDLSDLDEAEENSSNEPVKSPETRKRGLE
ncbi:Uncharacterised protein [uncultured archaeon]|nr:Uncharacterised protein [uncultured archaeon]